MVSHEHTMKMQRDNVKEKLGALWSNSKNYSLRKDEVNDCEYYWPNIDRFSFPQQIVTVKPVITSVNSFVKRKQTVLQAGGNCGIYTREYAQHYENVYTFEPDATNMNCLVLNTSDCNNIIKFQACLGESQGMTAIQNPLEIMDIGSIHVKTPKELHENMLVVESKANIPILTIDDIAFSTLDLIHLDIEGYELFALKGGSNTIKKYKPVIVLEVCEDGHSEKYGYNRNDLEIFLQSLDYVFIEKIDANGDNVYMHKSLVPS
jgi:FkbM family methyltransferase|tara:strand:+ start:248 stop:1033 length:786 start_codon:yes stop_codon:yes gene_type:complete